MKHTIKISHDDDGRRLWKIIKNAFSSLPLTNIFKLFRKWEIKINGKRANAEDYVKFWDEITVFSKESTPKIIKEKNKISEYFFKKNFHVLYEDKDILAVNKPAWIAVHQGTKHYQGQTMIDLAEHYIDVKYWKLFVQLVHRIDSDTSWILLFAKSWKTLRAMNQLIKDKLMTKYYYTLVFWKLNKPSWKIISQIEKHEWKKFNSMIVPKSKTENSVEAITHYKVKKHFWSTATLLDIDLKTWRMHQIRVHTNHIWHPVIGDKMYWDFKQNREFEKQFWLKRQFLHAYYVKFKHPDSHKTIEIKAELSEDLKKCLEKIE